MRWMFFEEDFIQNGLASLRHWTQTHKLARRSPEMVDAKRAVSRKTLDILERWLQGRAFLTDAGYTIADMSLFAYISRAGEAGIDLTAFPAVTAWIERVRSQPNFLEAVPSLFDGPPVIERTSLKSEPKSTRRVSRVNWPEVRPRSVKTA